MVLTLVQLEVFLLILARLAGIFLQTPVLSARSIPGSVKIALALWISVILWFVIPVPRAVPQTAVLFVLAAVNEVLIGAMIGFICYILFSVFQAAGDIIDLQMGLSVASSFDPMFGSTVTVVGRLCFYIALLVFLMANGHHMVISAVKESFTLLPLGGWLSFKAGFIVQLFSLSTTLWYTAVQLSAPAVLIIFISDFCFGIVSRVAPQVNVFMLGFQVKPSLGLWALLISLPIFIKHIMDLVPEMAVEIMKMFAYLKP